MSGARSSHAGILRAALAWSAVATAALAVAGGAIGMLVAGVDGLWSALLGVVVAGVFLALTAVIVLVAGRQEGPEHMPAFFGIVFGGWAVKLVVFVAAMLALRAVPWLDGRVFFFSLLASVAASLVIDIVVLARARVPYVGDVELPTRSDDPADRPGGR
ncbi:MAG: hypothetical protein QM602_01720 [Microbacterium sp.]